MWAAWSSSRILRIRSAPSPRTEAGGPRLAARASPDAFRRSGCHGLSVIGRPGPEIRSPNYLKVEAVPRSTSGIEAALRPVTKIEWRFTKWKKQEGGSQWFGGGRRNGSRYETSEASP